MGGLEEFELRLDRRSKIVNRESSAGEIDGSRFTIFTINDFTKLCQIQNEDIPKHGRVRVALMMR